MPKKQTKWIKKRHSIISAIAATLLYPIVRLKYGARIQKFKEQGKRQYFIMLNHQTDFDQFFVGISFKGPVYYVASEDLFSKGFISKLLKWAVAPIPIKKQSTDFRAVMNCIKIAKEGGTIAIAPEGNRTYSGKTEYIRPQIAGLAKALKLPIAFYRIEGGYGVQPRWSDKPRKGKMRAFVSKVLEPEDYLSLTDEELYEVIKNELSVNEAVDTGEFKHKRCAEYLERVIYICPHCGFSTFESNHDILKCKKCNFTVRYTKNKRFSAVSGDMPFEFVNDWYEYQEKFVNSTDVNEYNETPLYTEKAAFSQVVIYKRKKKICKDATIKLYGNRIEIDANGKREFLFDEVTAVSVLGRNKLNIYTKDELWQLKGDKRFNAVKYMHVYFRYNNIKKGGKDGEFLFLGL